MAVIAGMTNSFKQQLLEGVHDLSSDTMKIALYTSSADITPATTVYSATNEVSSAASTITRTCTWSVGTSIDIDSPEVPAGLTLGTSISGDSENPQPDIIWQFHSSWKLLDHFSEPDSASRQQILPSEAIA